MSDVGRFRYPFGRVILTVCALLVIGLWLAQINPYLNPADDSGRYMVLGESLARTGDLRLINDVRQVRDTLYVPGLPAVIAFWLKVTGQPPGAVIIPVKFTLMLCLLGTLPLFYLLLKRARLRRAAIAAAMIAYAACPAMISYANEVMSEMPLLLLCLAGIVLATTGKQSAESPLPSQEIDAENSENAPASSDHNKPANGQTLQTIEAVFSKIQNPHSKIPVWCILGALACAALAYYVRAAGAILLISLGVWFFHKGGWRWGLVSLAVTLAAVGMWQARTSRIIATDPPNTPHDTYMKQFTLKNPDDPKAGRIQMNARGIASRIKRCFPLNIGNIPRAVLFSMNAKGSAWQALFYVVAVPFTILALYGWRVAWKRGQYLVCGFCVLFWLFVALWPWVNPRFLVPLVPYILLFVFAAADVLYDYQRERIPRILPNAIATVAMGLLLVYYARVHAVVIKREHAPTLPGYALGRSRDEAGFYAGAAWLMGREPDTIVMARPAYLMHLYSGHPTTQIEPATRPSNQEIAYMLPNHVQYLFVDRWSWAHTENYLGPYLQEYGHAWTLVWNDPAGSGVRIYRRND